MTNRRSVQSSPNATTAVVTVGGYEFITATGGTTTSPHSVKTSSSAHMHTTNISSAHTHTSNLSQKKLESAVYAHIQAIRALGRTQTNTHEIAKALGLPASEVEKTVAALRQKGVKAVHG